MSVNTYAAHMVPTSRVILRPTAAFEPLHGCVHLHVAVSAGVHGNPVFRVAVLRWRLCRVRGRHGRHPSPRVSSGPGIHTWGSERARRVGQSAHSARSMSAVGVPAARRPGSAAMRLASTTAPTPMAVIVSAGTKGSATVSIWWANTSHRGSAHHDADRDADHRPDAHGHAGLPGHRCRQLPTGAAQGLEQRHCVSGPTREGSGKGR